MLAVDCASAGEQACVVNLWIVSKCIDEIHQDVLFSDWVNHRFSPNVVYKEAKRCFHVN